MAIDYFSIGNRIKQERIGKKLVQNELAEILEVSPGYISQLETGKTRISLELLVRIAEELGVNPGVLLNDTHTEFAGYKLMEIDNEMLDLDPDNRELMLEVAKLIHRKQRKDEKKRPSGPYEY